MYKKTPLVILMFLVVFTLFSQNETTTYNPNQTATDTVVQQVVYTLTEPEFKKYWSFGGNIGLSFWNGGADILVGPKAYYNISPKFLTGFGLTYIYSEYNSNINGYHSNSFGGSILLAARPVNFLQISTEYEGLQTNYSGYYSDEYFVSALYLGLSFATGPVSFGIRYDVLYDVNKSIYRSAWNPIIGFYF